MSMIPILAAAKHSTMQWRYRALSQRFPNCNVSQAKVLFFSTDSEKRLTSALKKLMKPFFLKCHPDVQTSLVAKQVNLEALKTLNSFIDTLDATCDGRIVEWPKKLQVEFMLVNTEITARRRKPVESISRRSIELIVPPVSIRDSIISSKGRDKQQSMQRLFAQIKKQILKLLQVAKIEAPIEAQEDLPVHDGEHEPFDIWDDILDREILQDEPLHGTRFSSKGRPKNRYEQSRETFVNSFNEEKYHEMWAEALRNKEADEYTEGLVKNNKQRRRWLVNQIIAKVRIDKDANIQMLDQLITLRRLSLILEDNFDELYMEDFGKMWEELLIILTDPRNYGTSSSALNRRRKKGQESGFRFTYCADNRVIVHIPIDARDGEIVKELSTYLHDWFHMFGVGDGLEALFQKEEPPVAS